MFRRFARLLRITLPFSLAVTMHLNSNPFVSMKTQDSPPFYSQSGRIKIISDIEEYTDNEPNPEKAVILCQLHDDQFIDRQLIQLAQVFEEQAKERISAEYEFLFVKGEKHQGEDFEHYFVVYNNKGEKIVSIDPYLNYNRDRPELQVNSKPLVKRLIETINGCRELRLTNITQEIAIIQNTSNYSSLLIVPDEQNNSQVDSQLASFLKENEIKSRSCQKIIVKDEVSRNILGLRDKAPGVYLLAAANDNLLPDYRQKIDTFKVGEKQCFLLPVQENLSERFVFPPIQPAIAADELVLNLYVNRNNNTSQLEEALVKELAKPQYRKFHKALYYSSDVQNAALILELSDYSKLSLTTFDQKKPLEPTRVRQILGNSFEWNYKVDNTNEINSEAIAKWIEQSTGDNRMERQFFRSEKRQDVWATYLTANEYKKKRDEPNDKVIYHFSEHCHGCKKFGGKYELFAKNRHQFPGVSFYRINNDHNKAEGVRNYNSTPVFVYYKQGCNSPFIYRQPIFTEALFEDFLRITGNLSLIDYKAFQENIKSRKESEEMLKEVLAQLK